MEPAWAEGRLQPHQTKSRPRAVRTESTAAGSPAAAPGTLPKDDLEVAPAGSGSPSPNCQNGVNLSDLCGFFSKWGSREAAFAMLVVTLGSRSWRALVTTGARPSSKLGVMLVKSDFLQIYPMVSRSIAEAEAGRESCPAPGSMR